MDDLGVPLFSETSNGSISRMIFFQAANMR